MRGNKKGFTLIEIIIALAIIGVLITFAGVKYSQYTKEADGTAQLDQMKALEKENKEELLMTQDMKVDVNKQYKLNICSVNAIVAYLTMWQEEAVPRKDLKILVGKNDVANFKGSFFQSTPDKKITEEDKIQNKYIDTNGKIKSEEVRTALETAFQTQCKEIVD